ncbi:MAG: hypothetical protein JNL64_07415 [Blastocatellia bacterium]|nr:hypothetical protein [Blastocatellia bacterium]
MLKRYTFWFSAAIIFQLLTGAFHAVSLFVKPEPANDTERQMLELITTYKMDAGGGFTPTYSNLFTALSACFSLLCFYAAATNGYLLVKLVEPRIMKGILAVNVAIFGICFLLMAVFTFLPPIVCTGFIFFNLLAAYIVCPKIESNV